MCCGQQHNPHRPVDICGWCAFFCRQIPPCFAVLLILLNVIPYYVAFLPRLHRSYQHGDVSFFYYLYCHLGMAITETLVFVNFFLAVSTPPGYVEREPWSHTPVFRGRPGSEFNTHEVRQVGLDGKLRFCFRCEIYKPDNAHHCRSCRRCVYRMDHHCPWINNCVGRDNLKYFLLFLAYIPLGGFHIATTTIYSLCYHFPFFSSADLGDGVLLVGSAVLSAVMGFSFLLFAAHFVYLAVRGETTVANVISYRRSDQQRHQQLIKEEREKFLDEVFGLDRRWWRLICPVSTRRPPENMAIV
ncbi:zinc finger protein [Trypanosoma theileri]|uniref:Palmitoyltransferase n=1 Tax=Trypanosoma theileri TaxID=67003 RepID=A0A1X0NY23_9TRYP|nr:zinc finger protein [Trypanosoma theileri]ORC89129.1 zinc finger protein [Trypanosoma theileri]